MQPLLFPAAGRRILLCPSAVLSRPRGGRITFVLRRARRPAAGAMTARPASRAAGAAARFARLVQMPGGPYDQPQQHDTDDNGPHIGRDPGKHRLSSFSPGPGGDPPGHTGGRRPAVRLSPAPPHGLFYAFSAGSAGTAGTAAAPAPAQRRWCRFQSVRLRKSARRIG